MAFLTEDLLESAKSRSFVPISQSTFEESDIITIATEELLLKMVSDILSVREEFFLTSKATAITANIDHYTIPKMAIGNTVNFVSLRDSNNSEIGLTRINAAAAVAYAGQTGTPEAYYFEGDEVVLCPKPSASTNSVVFSYFRKPNKMIATSSCAKITAVSSAAGTTTFTVNTDLSASLSVGSTVDFLSGKSPYLLWYDEVAITAITSTTIAVATSAVSDAASSVEPVVNDYICPTGYANIPQIPDELVPVLAQLVAVRMIASMGDLNKWQAAKAELKEMREEALKLIKNRAESAPRRVSSNGIVGAFTF
jgi:hypothetical protein